MARAMNVEKRTEALQSILTKTAQHSTKAAKVSEELIKTFDGVRTPEGKEARRLAKEALKLSKALERTATSIVLSV